MKTLTLPSPPQTTLPTRARLTTKFPRKGAIAPLPTPSLTLQRKPGCACGGSCPCCQTEQALQTNLQDKFTISKPGDRHEREADRVASQVMGMPAPAIAPMAEAEAPLQRKAASASPAMPSSLGSLQGSGQPLTAATRTFFEPRFGTDLSSVRMHTDAAAGATAQALNARAFTLGHDIVFGPQAYAPDAATGRQLLAHELTHVLQQRPATIQRDPTPPSPRNAALVRRARERLAVLEPLVTELRLQSTRTAQDRLDTLRQREALDAASADPGPPGQRQRIEEANLGSLNQRPLQIEVGASTVTFRVSFQVKFEDPALGDRPYEALVQQMQTGIAQVWNQRLSGDAFGGRQFRLVPNFARVATDASRDLNYWLVYVRSQDLGVVTYPGCTLDPTDPDVPTSVTSSTCDGGVMIVPPRHIDRPSVLGHETLHLFGLVDRYMSITSRPPGRPPIVENDPIRETGGRPDPLGTEPGTILREDLGFLFAHLGVYDQEQSRLRASIATLERETHRLREIIRLGRDPYSLIDSVIRRDFTDRMIRSAEDL